MKFSKEIPAITAVILPFLYLAYIWNDLPQKVPMHWDVSGNVNRWGDKAELILLIFLLPVLIYAIFLLVPIIDPKNKIKYSDKKFQNLKFALTIFTSGLALFIIYSAQKGSASTVFLVIFVGLLFSLIGNYLKTVKPNYFIGIRTPWTLENETIWKETHKFAGILWFFGGLAVVIAGIFLKKEYAFPFLLTVTVIISLIPVIYSYVKFRKIKKGTP